MMATPPRLRLRIIVTPSLCNPATPATLQNHSLPPSLLTPSLPPSLSLSLSLRLEMDSEHLVVLLSAYLDKQNPVFGGFRRRFVVLTHDALHWFKVSEGVRQ
jgi:hypothetical protein